MKTLLLLLACCATLRVSAQIDSVQLIKDIKTLSDDKFEGRKTGTKGNRLAQLYLLDRFKQLGLTPFSNTYEQPFYFSAKDKRIMGTNLYGYIPGKSDSVIVISAHYDHVGIGRANGTDSIYNGADDNASGVSALLGMIGYFKKNPPQHTLIFAAFDGEEMGLQGAKAFLMKPPVPVKRIVLNINMDMIGRNDNSELYVSGGYHYPQLKKYVTAVQSAINLKLGHDKPDEGHNDWTNQSDHYEFKLKGIPFLYFGVEDHPDYHKPGDEFSKIQPAFYNAAKAVLDVVLAADKN
ncbi:M28 family peptidase [Chitinophaga sedimenti]|uniref:M28 family peptidase n=1 Tax=Chitinophaga sedimenti TaxID=2033606 RepID=UPI0020030F5C|nr:M28 family peptidase [Chitinophaga sedimenti]MCK7558639.1 M28 family peptidase [Chitinophaga sedimenti]